MNADQTPKDNKSDAAYKKQQAQQDGGISDRHGKPDLPPTPCNHGEKTNDKKPLHEWIKYFAEIIGIFGGLVGVVLLILQYKDMTTATNAAVEQSKILHGQLVEMQNSRKLDERAFVFATGAVKTSTPKTNAAGFISVTFRVEVKNSGKTPALNFRSVIGFDNQTNDIAKIDGYDTNDFMVLAPNSAADAILHVNTKIGEPLWICGINRYEDIFGSNHWSTYCWKVEDDFRTFYGTPYNNSSDDVQSSQNH